MFSHTPCPPLVLSSHTRSLAHRFVFYMYGLKPVPGVSTYLGTKRMVFQQQQLNWMLSFGFVSGHDFSRAVKEGKGIGLQPLQWHILHEMHRASMVQKRCQSRTGTPTWQREKSAGAKAQIFVGRQRPD
jgi:hypothetical protein